MHNKAGKIKYKEQILLSAILLLALVLGLFFYTGVDYSDSLAYSEFAYNLSKGSLALEVNHSAFRLGLLYPVSLIYSMFGVSQFSSNILVLIFSLASIILIYKFGSLLFNTKVGLLSAALLSFFPLDVVYSTRLLTDLPSAFFVSLSVYLFLKQEKMHTNIKSSIYLVISGMSLGIAYLIREMSLLIVIFFAAYFIYNMKFKINYALAALGFIMVASLELVYFFSLTGNAFFRLSLVSSDWVAAMKATNFFGTGSFPISILHHLYIIFTDNLLGTYYLFIFTAVTYAIVYKKKEAYALLLWFIPVLAYIVFGTASLSSYIPFPAGSRFLSIVTMPSILILSYFLMQNESVIKRVLLPSVVVLLFVTSVAYIYTSPERFSLDEIENAYNYINKLPTKKIYTDQRTAMVLSFLDGYKGSHRIEKFSSYKYSIKDGKYLNVFVSNLSGVKDSYIVVNWKIINFLTDSKKGVRFPDQIYNLPENWVLKKEIGKGSSRVAIYYAPK